MEIEVSLSTERQPSSVLVVDYFENKPAEGDERFEKNSPFFELVKPAFESGDFTGKWKQNIMIYSYGKLPEARLLLIGFGRTSRNYSFFNQGIFRARSKKN